MRIGHAFDRAHLTIAGLDPTDHEAAAAGLPPIDSVDQWPYLSGATSAPPRTEIPFGTTKDPSDVWATKTNDLEVHTLVQADTDTGSIWKLQLGKEPFAVWTGPQTPNASAFHLPSPMGVFGDCGSGCLFDLTADPCEHSDVAAAHPELVATMREALSKHNGTVFAPLRPNNLAMACAAVTTKYRDPKHDFGWWGPFADHH